MKAFLVGSAALALGACGGTTVIPPSPSAAPGSTSTPSPAPGDAEEDPSDEPEELICDRVVEDFADDAAGSFPSQWRARDDGQEELASATYQVEEDGDDKVLHATWGQETVTIGTRIEGWDLKEYPVLQWRWKAVTLPAGADESDGDLNDTGAAVYAIWKVGFPMYVRGIKYAWSSTLPVGTRTTKRMKYDQMLVVDSGNDHVGEWQTVQVDVGEHARTYWEGEDIGLPDGIALMTDADSTTGKAEAYYADFTLCRRP